MKNWLPFTFIGLLLCSQWSGEAVGRGFGGFRGGYGGFRGGYGGFSGYRSGGFSGYRSGGFGGYGGYHYGGYSSGYRSNAFGGSYSGARSYSGYTGWRGGAGTSSYDRSYETARGGTISTEGNRGFAYGPRGVAAGGDRETSITTAGGRTYTGSSAHGVAVGPYGRTVGGAEHFGTASGPRGTVSRGWESAFAGRTMPTDFGLAHYSTVGAVGVHTTNYWSHGYMTTHAGYVRTNFGYYNCFHPGWWNRYPGCWHPVGWVGYAAWAPIAWPTVVGFLGLGSEPEYTYDYGNNIVYSDNNVYVGGQNAGTAQQYAQQATAIADAGQTANAPADQEWKAIGVFALVSGDEKTSNNIFQLAINKDGIIRGNYYDGVMDTNTQVYGSVDKKSQRAAWTIGKKNDRVFETGIYNLTKSELPVLVHLGDSKTQQWMLVRVEQPPQQK